LRWGRLKLFESICLCRRGRALHSSADKKMGESFLIIGKFYTNLINGTRIFFLRTLTKTYEKEKEYYRALYEAKGVGGKVIAEDDDTMTIKTGLQHDKLTLLFDLQAINELGGSVMKRVYFTLENNDYGENMKITEINY
jgi:hypothetical protein